jgi:hypothetical protein
MLRVELHCHTIYSKDSLLKPERLVETCRRKGIDRVMVTDHNTIAGALRAQALDPGRVIVGEEIMTQAGELLAFFVSQEVPPDLPPGEAIRRLRDQGAFISVSHPFDHARYGHWEEKDLLEILPFIDAIETFNARCMQARCNRQAQVFARQHGIQGTAGSDAHVAFELGRAAMLLPEFHDAESFKQALLQSKIEARLSSPLVHFTSRYAVWVKKLYRRLGKNIA